MPPQVKVDVNWEHLGRELYTHLQSGLGPLIDQGHEDLAKYTQQLANDAIEVAQEPDPAVRDKLFATLLNQAKAIQERQSIRADRAGWAALQEVSKSLLGAFFSGLKIVL